VFLRSGGTIPILSTFQKTLGIPTVLMGFALPQDRVHAPNEKFYLPNFFRGIETSIWFMDALASAHGLHVCSSSRPGRNTVEKNAEAIL
jgi:acetylornithine deacetylase/succinyl-diaminopimelate desuccinylase-like protein